MTMIDDEMLMAFADGELNAVDAARVETAVAEDPDLRARLEAQRAMRARLSAFYAPVAEEEVPERFRAMLETNVVDLGAARSARPRPTWRIFSALAATLVIGLAIGRAMPWPGGGGPVGFDNGKMMAEGDLAQALETQLASAPREGQATRIGLTFAAADGRLCRTFEGQALSGLACRGERDWQLMMTAPGAGAQRGDYRQASSGNALVLQAAQEMMAGEALDGAGERRARDAGWRQGPATN
jgi:hypothetical protein